MASRSTARSLVGSQRKRTLSSKETTRTRSFGLSWSRKAMAASCISSMRKRVEPEVSMTSATVKGCSTGAKYATCCSLPSSKMRKSSLCSPAMKRPSRSSTETGTVTSEALTLTTSPSPTSSPD
jgi:hypothetical protein